MRRRSRQQLDVGSKKSMRVEVTREPMAAITARPPIASNPALMTPLWMRCR